MQNPSADNFFGCDLGKAFIQAPHRMSPSGASFPLLEGPMSVRALPLKDGRNGEPGLEGEISSRQSGFRFPSFGNLLSASLNFAASLPTSVGSTALR